MPNETVRLHRNTLYAIIPERGQRGGAGMNFRACKDCIYFAPFYGAKNKQGKPTVSNYWCVKKQGFVKKFPKECKWKER